MTIGQSPILAAILSNEALRPSASESSLDPAARSSPIDLAPHPFPKPNEPATAASSKSRSISPIDAPHDLSPILPAASPPNWSGPVSAPHPVEPEPTTFVTPAPQQGTPPDTASPSAAEDADEYQAEKLAANVWRFAPAPRSPLDLNSMIGRLSELFHIYLVTEEAAGAAQQLTSAVALRQTRLGQELILVECAYGLALIDLLRNDATRGRSLMIASAATHEDVANSLRNQLFSFRRPSIFVTQISTATNSQAETLLEGKIAVLVTDESDWEIFAAIDPRTEFRLLGFSQPPR